MRHGGAVARATRWTDAAVGHWSMFVYHFAFALPLGLVTRANLNFMLCPTDGLSGLLGLVLAPENVWPSYHTPVTLLFPLLSQLLASGYLAAATVLLAVQAGTRRAGAKKRV